MNALGLMSQINSLSLSDLKALNPIAMSSFKGIGEENSTMGIMNPLMGGKMADELIKI